MPERKRKTMLSMDRRVVSVFRTIDFRLVAQRPEVHLHQRMGESNFGTIDCPIPCCFEDG